MKANLEAIVTVPMSDDEDDDIVKRIKDLTLEDYARIIARRSKEAAEAIEEVEFWLALERDKRSGAIDAFLQSRGAP
jgi:hypothetical protein